MEEGEYEGEEDYSRIEEKLEDFQDTMERVQARFFDKKDPRPKKQGLDEEENSSDIDMIDEGQLILEDPKGEA